MAILAVFGHFWPFLAILLISRHTRDGHSRPKIHRWSPVLAQKWPKRPFWPFLDLKNVSFSKAQNGHFGGICLNLVQAESSCTTESSGRGPKNRPNFGQKMAIFDIFAKIPKMGQNGPKIAQILVTKHTRDGCTSTAADQSPKMAPENVPKWPFWPFLAIFGHFSAKNGHFGHFGHFGHIAKMAILAVLAVYRHTRDGHSNTENGQNPSK